MDTLRHVQSVRLWHRFHFPVGIFLIAFGVARVADVLTLSRLHGGVVRELHTATGFAGPLLVVIGVGDLALAAVALVGLLRRRGVWILLAVLGRLVESALLCVSAALADDVGGLVEHGAYLVGFALVLACTYAIGVAARAARQRRTAPAEELTRTQEMALAAVARWRRTLATQGGAPTRPPAEASPNRPTPPPRPPRETPTPSQAPPPSEAVPPEAPDAASAAESVPSAEVVPPAEAVSPQEVQDALPPEAKPPAEDALDAEPSGPGPSGAGPTRNDIPIRPKGQVTRQDIPTRPKNAPDPPSEQ